MSRPHTGRIAPAAKPGRFVAPQHRILRAGSELYAQDEANDEIFTVIEGWVFLHHILEDGRRQILEFLLPGDSCGFLPLDGHARSHAAEALTDVTLAIIPRSQFAAVMAADPGYASAIVLRLCESLSAAHEALIDTGRRTAVEAVSNLVLRLERRIAAAGEGAADGPIDFPLTQEHLGDALGLTAVHVCRTLRVLRERGILTLGRHKLQIHDRAALRDVGGREVEWPDTPTCPGMAGRAA